MARAYDNGAASRTTPSASGRARVGAKSDPPSSDKVDNLTYRIANELGIAIVTRAHAVGGPMPSEDQLRRRYNSSRTAVREAIKMLTAKGLVYSWPRLGIRVQPEENWNLLDRDVFTWHCESMLSDSLLLEFTELRLSMEPAAAALAARGARTPQTTAIKSAVERLYAADRGDGDSKDAEIAFHVSVLRATSNPFFAQFAGLTATVLRFSQRPPVSPKRLKHRRLANCQKVADAIAAANPKRAEEAMRSLIQEPLAV
jgi:DNA-binding FadR family transcriptional regulator